MNSHTKRSAKKTGTPTRVPPFCSNLTNSVINPKMPPIASPWNMPGCSLAVAKLSMILRKPLTVIYSHTGKPKKMALPIDSSNQTGNTNKLRYKNHKTKVSTIKGEKDWWVNAAARWRWVNKGRLVALVFFEGIHDNLQWFLLIMRIRVYD